MTLKEMLESIRNEVIEPLRESKGNGYLELYVKEKFYSKQLKTILSSKFYEKLDEGDIYGYPLEVIYILYCYPVKLRQIIKDEKKCQEYWDFFFENYPMIKNDRNMRDFYRIVIQ